MSDSDSDTVSIVELASVADSEESVQRLTRQQYQQLLKQSDPDYHTVKRRFGKKMKTVEVYSTKSNPGYRIRNPITGHRMQERVGTLAERSFFKIRITSFGDGSEPITLFYDSPETYERHMSQRVSQDIKQAWRAKNKDIPSFEQTPSSIMVR